MDRTGAALGALALPAGIALTAATGAGSRLLLTGVSAPGAAPGEALAGCAAGVASLLSGWLTLCLLLCLLAQLPGAGGRLAGQVREKVTPMLVRRWAAIVIGTSVSVTCLADTAVAAVHEGPTGPSPGWRPAPTSPTHPAPSFPSPGWPATAPAGPSTGETATHTIPTPVPGWTPRRPPARQQGDPHLLTGRQRTVDKEPAVVVRRGDSLWSIAAARLGPHATAGEVARAWPRWYTANADDIGTDPHTLLPGMRLTPPTDRP